MKDDRYILFILQAAWVLATRCHPCHIVSYAPGDSIVCCLQATRIILGIALIKNSVLNSVTLVS
ncbi:hypothetical protein C9426_22725 [Serratia sp. S1B]|nr:hypothetical protein C9426_22725 [Serratia sp. S1B]